MDVSEQPVVHDGQDDCRSLRDAIFKHRGGDDSGPLLAKVIVGLVQRPDDEITGMLFVEAETNGQRQLVRLPNCTHFKALTQDNQPISLEVTVLDEGRLDENGVVSLVDGRSLRNVTMKPGAPVMYEFGDLDDAIVRQALVLLRAEQQCYREISPQYMSGVLALDYAKVREIRIPRLKRLIWQIHACFESVPHDRIEKALRRAGFEFPRSKREVKAVAG